MNLYYARMRTMECAAEKPLGLHRRKRKTPPSYILMVLLLVFVNGASANALTRRLLVRDIAPSKTCRNTEQGRTHVTDDVGTFCERKDLDYSTGCCQQGQKHTCDTCDPSDQCCSGYEQCVSCCMHDVVEHPGKPGAFRSLHRQDSALWRDSFDYCRGICRTHGHSTAHENAYIGPRHHCFSVQGTPHTAPAPPKGALDGVTVVLGPSGVSCDTACALDGLVCSVAHLQYLNSCDQLRLKSACEAGCVAETSAAHMPSYVDPDAQKPQRPAICLVSGNGGSSSSGASGAGYSCDGREQQVRRLCSCLPKTGQR